MDVKNKYYNFWNKKEKRSFISELGKDMHTNEQLMIKNNNKLKYLNFSSLKTTMELFGAINVAAILPVSLLCLFLNIPAPIHPLVSLLSSSTIAIIGIKQLDKKNNVTGRFKNIFNPKKEKERLEESYNLELVNEILNNRNIAIDDYLISEDEFQHLNYNLVKNGMYIVDKNIISKTKEELVSKMISIQNDLSKKYDELDTLTKLLFLENKKEDICSKTKIFSNSLLSTFLVSGLLLIPSMTFLFNPVTSLAFIPIITNLSVCLITFLGSIAYYNQDNKNKINTVNSISEEIKSEKENLVSYSYNTLSPTSELTLKLAVTRKSIKKLYNILNKCKAQLARLEKENKNIEKKEKLDNTFSYVLDNNLDMSATGPKLILK